VTAVKPAELLLLPGLDGTARLFDRLEECLGDRIPTRRLSYPADPAMGYAALADYVIANLSDKPTILLGESFSGPIAIDVAGRRPQDIAGVVLSSTFVRSPWPSAMLRLAAKINAHNVPKILRRWAMMGQDANLGLQNEFDTVIRGLHADLIAARLREVSRVDASAGIEQITVPILALHGRHDRLVSFRRLEVLLRGKVQAACVLLDGPHMLLQVNPEQSAREIEGFWNKIQRP
jgi:pimeloyl-[acyl-carrier protein] methyl ester esterase